jgi:orotidine-5'-phosphate decarboxylase
MTRKELIDRIKGKKTFLCVGLDTDINKIPKHLLDAEDPIFEFNKQIINATIDYAAAYKPNLAFYECYGTKGLISLEKTIDYLNSFSDKVFTIADAKRGDIGNTSTQYAKAFFETMNFDAVTVAPYMGEDSVSPFLSYENKWIVVLALTSNKGSDDFQLCRIPDESNRRLFEVVLERSSKWGNIGNMMYVVGATKAEMLSEIRKIVPDHFLLVPGVGAQGGSLQDVANFGMTKDCGLLVNASRSIIYASSGSDFVEKARQEASNMQAEMEILLKKFSVI